MLEKLFKKTLKDRLVAFAVGMIFVSLGKIGITMGIVFALIYWVWEVEQPNSY